MNSTNPAYDGGVLEISIGGGPFTDILAAGGSFASGGYTRTIGPTDPLAQNPLDGRQAWAGISGGFISTVANLPAAAAGQTVQFKWRLGTDLGNDWGGLGWYIDSVSVKDGYACCTPAVNNDLAIAQNEAPNPGAVGQGMSYTLTANNIGPAPAPALVITDSLPANVTVVFISPGCTNIGGTIVCRSPLLLSGGTTNFTVIVTPNVPGNFTNVVSVSSLANDSNLANNSTTNIVPVFAPLVPPTILLNSLTLSGGVFSLSLNSVSGLNYSLEYKNNLTDGTWTPVLPVVAGNGGPVILQDTNSPLPISRFYRVNCF
jgi:conserved repeat domain